MRASPSPQLRFLLRGSLLLLTMLALWWFVLLPPMMDTLRFTSELALIMMPGGSAVGSAEVASNGDWEVRTPIWEWLAKQDSVQQAFGRAPGAPPVKVRSFKISVAQRIPGFFLLSFPLFWAVMLAGPWSSRLWKAALIGTLILAALAQFSLLFYIAYTIETKLRLVTSYFWSILWSAGNYLVINVVPYVIPVVLGVWLQKDLREQIFSWDPAAAPSSPPPPVKEVEDKARRGRARGK